MRRKPALAVAAAIFAVLVIVVFIARIGEPLGVDQGLFACFSRWVPRGWLPYRDLFDSKPPLFLYWWGLAGVLPGDVARAAWSLELVWLVATLIAAYALAKRAFGRVAGLGAAAWLFFGLWSPGFGGFWSRAQAEELLALPMIGSAWFALDAEARPNAARGALLAGVLVGVCGLFKIPSMAIAAAWAIFWLARGRDASSVRRVALLVAGIAIPWALAFVWFAAHSATARFVEGVFVYHRFNSAFIAPPWGSVLDGFTSQLTDVAAPLLVAAVIGLALLMRRGAREATWLAAWMAVTLAAVVLQRQLAGYHFLLAMPALAVAGGYGVAVLVRAARAHGRSRWIGTLGLLALAALVTRSAFDWDSAYRPGADLVLGRIDRAHYLARIQQGAYSNATEEQAAAWLRARTTREQGVLVWGLSPGIYALADRHPTTRFPFHKILLTDAPLSRMIPGLAARRAELAARLLTDPPAYVLVGAGDQNGFEPLDSRATMLRFPALHDMLERDYVEETRIGVFTVYRRRP